MKESVEKKSEQRETTERFDRLDKDQTGSDLFRNAVFVRTSIVILALLYDSRAEWVIPALASYASTNLYDFYKTREKGKTTELFDNNFDKVGAATTLLVYKGNKPLEGENSSLKENDAFIYVELPKIEREDGSQFLTQSHKRAEQAAYRLALISIGEKLEEESTAYQAISIHMPDGEIPFDQLKSKGTVVRNRNLLRGRSVVEADKSGESLMLSSEEFAELQESLMYQPFEDFEKGCLALGDTRLLGILEEMRQTESRETLTIGLNDFSRRLHVILHGELAKRYEGSELRNGNGIGHSRERTTLTTHLVQGKEGLLLRLLGADTGPVILPLKNILDGDMNKLGDVVETPNKDRNAEIAYILQRFLEEYDIEDLLRPRITSIEELSEELKKEGMGIIPSRDAIGALIDMQKTNDRDFLAFHRSFAPIILASLLALTLHGAYKIGKEPVSETVENVKSTVVTNYSLNEDENQYYPETVSQFGDPPSHSLDWKIEQHGELLFGTSGYYTTATAHELTDKGEWKINNHIDDFVRYPDVPDRDFNGIELTKRISAEEFKNNSVKIPIKNNTKIGTIKVTGKNGWSVRFSTTTLTDGTVSIQGIPSYSGEFVDIQVFLEETGVPDSQVKASMGTDGAINFGMVSMLHDSVREQSDFIITQNEKNTPLDNLETNAILSTVISLSHEYSLDVPDDSPLRKAKSAVEIVNAIADMTGCFCQTCNTELVLLSGLAEKGSNLSLAFGYLHGVDNPGSAENGEYLLGETSHAYGISMEAQIFDATASEIADDKTTQDYFNRHKTSRNFDEEWQAMNDEFSDENIHIPTDRPIQRSDEPDRSLFDDERVRFVALLSALAGAYGSIKLVEKKSGSFQEAMTSENVQRQIDRVFLEQMEYIELARSYHFFNYAAFGNGSAYVEPWNRELDEIFEKYPTKTELLKAMKQIFNGSSLDSIYKSPHKSESERNTSIFEKYKTRLLAKYITSVST